MGTKSGTLVLALRKQPKPGDMLGDKYLITRLIGIGGMSTVFEATRIKRPEGSPHRQVAIKVLDPELAENTDNVRRFLQEARATTTVRHRFVAQIFEVAAPQDETSPYIVMELLEGRDYEEILNERDYLTTVEAVDAVIMTALGLAEAHRRGVIHRDLKPANLFQVAGEDKLPEVRIVDFGLARFLDQTTTLSAGVLVGTPEYMSPEQILGEELDKRSDVWAAGVVLFELLTGNTPFVADIPLASLDRVLNAEIPRLDVVREGVPPGLSQLVGRCLSRDREARPESLTELVWHLRPYASKRVVQFVADERAVASRRGHTLEMERTVDGLPESVIPPPSESTAPPAQSVSPSEAPGSPDEPSATKPHVVLKTVRMPRPSAADLIKQLTREGPKKRFSFRTYVLIGLALSIIPVALIVWALVDP